MSESAGLDKIDPSIFQKDEVETLILTLLALSEVAEDLPKAKLGILREFGVRLDKDRSTLLEVSAEVRLALFSELRFGRTREGYLIDIRPLHDDLADTELRVSTGVEGLGASLDVLATLTSKILRDPISFAHRHDFVARLAGLIGLPWPRPGQKPK